jgi:hypothetical protein
VNITGFNSKRARERLYFVGLIDHLRVMQVLNGIFHSLRSVFHSLRLFKLQNYYNRQVGCCHIRYLTTTYEKTSLMVSIIESRWFVSAPLMPGDGLVVGFVSYSTSISGLSIGGQPVEFADDKVISCNENVSSKPAASNRTLQFRSRQSNSSKLTSKNCNFHKKKFTVYIACVHRQCEQSFRPIHWQHCRQGDESIRDEIDLR